MIRCTTARPRRAARMTHFCSFRLIQSGNRSCRTAKDRASDINQAEGVRDDLSLSASKTRITLWRQRVAGQLMAPCGFEQVCLRRLPRVKKSLLPCGNSLPLGCGVGSLLASKLWSFLASAEAQDGAGGKASSQEPGSGIEIRVRQKHTSSGEVGEAGLFKKVWNEKD